MCDFLWISEVFFNCRKRAAFRRPRGHEERIREEGHRAAGRDQRSGHAVVLIWLSTLTYRDHLAKTAGASVFAVVTNFDAGPGGVPMIVTKLAVAVRRKLVVYTWQDAEFLQEYPIPERARTLSWASPDRICVGYSRNYTIISLPVGTTTDLFQQQAGGGGGGSLQSSLNSSFNSLNSLGTMGIAAMGIGAGSKLAKPLAVPLPQGELLVMKDCRCG
ncbi:MAG: hypothetical protein BJ554DRAFT_3434 [Olpidium bornovanus]|uniref:CNH domain-containing protein n=1 Tax=Olpidium bornovanus TaxID=278681 RepID=A0A8H7ZNS2_9FUNG|nr:MAG: hypothetical protein BJ554DRAFT_3434 [Olpidium bornovanus]